MKENQKTVHWFQKLEADIADTESGRPKITDGQWQLLRKSLVFEKHIFESYRWVYETALALDRTGEPSLAYHGLRGVLFALRDRMPLEEVFQFSAQMPVHIRGIFFEGYNPTNKPQKFHVAELLDRIEQEVRPQSDLDPRNIFKAVLQVLHQHISEGELNDIYAAMPGDIKTLWDEIRK